MPVNGSVPVVSVWRAPSVGRVLGCAARDVGDVAAFGLGAADGVLPVALRAGSAAAVGVDESVSAGGPEGLPDG
jgi:hypothetical protein